MIVVSGDLSILKEKFFLSANPINLIRKTIPKTAQVKIAITVFWTIQMVNKVLNGSISIGYINI